MMFQNDDYGVQTNYTLHLFSIFWLLCSDCIADLIKKLELCLTAVSVLLKIRYLGTPKLASFPLGLELPFPRDPPFLDSTLFLILI